MTAQARVGFNHYDIQQGTITHFAAIHVICTKQTLLDVCDPDMHWYAQCPHGAATVWKSVTDIPKHDVPSMCGQPNCWFLQYAKEGLSK